MVIRVPLEHKVLLGAQGAIPIANDYTITVVSTGSGNKFYVDGVETQELTLYKGFTYTFTQTNSSNASHPIRFSTTNDGTHNSGTQYATGLTYTGTAGSDGVAKLTVTNSAPSTLYYFCLNHSGMGGQINITIISTGAQGATGARGVDGYQGVDGLTGAQGLLVHKELLVLKELLWCCL